MFEKFNNQPSFHYSEAQLISFEKELDKTDSFKELMFKKNALELKNGSTYIITYPNIKKYRKKFLTGEYKSLRPEYKTQVPYAFWSKMYIELKKRRGTEPPDDMLKINSI
jgi:hypothetical protein